MTSRELFETYFAPEHNLDLRMIGAEYTNDRTKLAWDAWLSSAGYYHLDGDG